MLVQSGCSQSSVGPIIQKVCLMIGIPATRCMSERTVQRAILEAGVAAKPQLAHEICGTKSLTISSDGTSNRHIDYVSRHIALKVPSYSDGTPKIVNRLLGVESAKNHTSETQLEGLKKVVDDMSNLYEASPLSKRHGNVLTPLTFTRKAKGMSGDHSADQKKLFTLFLGWKHDNLLVELGEDAIVEPRLADLVAAARSKVLVEMMDEAGGMDAWHELSVSEQESREAAKKFDLVRVLGQGVYSVLTEEQKRELDFCVRGGCCMHKELNSVKRGNTAMMSHWAEIRVEPPVLLANRDNSVTLQNTQSSRPDHDGTLTAAEQRALNVSARGGVKVCSLAGAIFNHKDDKKGQQDTYRWYMERARRDSTTRNSDSPHPRHSFLTTFPDTSNTRYHSYVDAAVVILMEYDFILEFMEWVRLLKEKSVLNHMEKNLVTGLLCWKTMTENSVLVFYGVAITYPYAAAVRGPGTENLNVLELGGLHERVISHIHCIINNPDLLISSHASYKDGTLDGKPWRKPEALAAVHRYAEKMPYLREMLLAFFKGTVPVWGRFTEEYAVGGTIYQATPKERDAAWMPSTNDANEGSLGTFRLHARHKPRTSMHQYNALAQVRRNDTEAFMETTYTEQDEHFGMKVARAMDSAGLEKQRRNEIIEHHESEVLSKRRRIERRNELAAKHAEKLSSANLVLLDEDGLMKLTKDQLGIQLDLHRERDPSVPKKGSRSKAQLVAAVLAAIVSMPRIPDVTDCISLQQDAGNRCDEFDEGDSGDET
ncbi:hypothetical protein BV22DRAFT_1026042 [Leucogyrophana mollusca]|uniref:Uncharacterized protein n=1 Tax=Leucogyrophana mollusca TaxID=85980 RepID=A0ACB8AWL1_9AGAM|nr:hypothetical protein BV22DRAFT_1026042 [Leucogyrophana mollusca]